MPRASRKKRQPTPTWTRDLSTGTSWSVTSTAETHEQKESVRHALMQAVYEDRHAHNAAQSARERLKEHVRTAHAHGMMESSIARHTGVTRKTITTWIHNK